MCPGSCKAITAVSGVPKGFRSGPNKGTMKRYLTLILIYAVCSVHVLAQQKSTTADAVTHIATALNHLSVLEFQEPVTMAAAGSTDFQVERQENKVFVKPMKAGASTDLFVWTASRRFAYELETTPEVKNMNFAIDNSAPAPAALPVVSPHVDEFADMMLTHAFLGAQEITPANPRAPKNQVSVRVEQVLRTRTTVYIHYRVENNSKRSYHLATPDAQELKAGHSDLALPSFAHKQLDPRLLANLSDVTSVSLPVAHSESAAEELGPGEATQGVIAIRQALDSPAVVELVFDSQVKATFVL